MEGGGFSQARANTLQPPGYAMAKDPKENRWRLRSKMHPEKSASYGAKSDCSDFDAMVFLLNFAWADALTRGLACPHDFEAMRPDGM